jgi:hypothetical protein
MLLFDMAVLTGPCARATAHALMRCLSAGCYRQPINVSLHLIGQNFFNQF